jgi:hypothetical protein
MDADRSGCGYLSGLRESTPGEPERVRMLGGEARAWPNLFVVGAPKAGTTTLYAHLAEHPEIFMCRPKEPHFFSDVTALPAWRGQSGVVDDLKSGIPLVPTFTNTHDYLQLFRTRGDEQVIGEASTSYLADPEVPARISRVSPDGRIIMLLRDPISRARSHHGMHVREGWERRSFAEAVEPELQGSVVDWAFRYVGNGFYAEAIRRYQSVFPGRVLILIYEDFFSDVRRGMDEVFRFLDVDPSHVPSGLPVLNGRVVPRNRAIELALRSNVAWVFGRRLLPTRVRHIVRDVALVPAPGGPDLPSAVRESLAAAYRDDVRAVEAMVDRRLLWLGRVSEDCAP